MTMIAQEQTMSQQNPAPEPQPAQPPEDQRPGERDLEIYRAVRIQLHKQKTVALTYGLTPGRISQIVKRVSRHLARLFPGEDLKLRFAEAKRMRLMDYECHERRVEIYRKCELALEQSGHPLLAQQWTYEGPAESNQPVKTVVKEREQPISMAALREMRRLNNEMQWGGGKPGRRDPEKGRRSGGKAAAVLEKLPPPECLSEADRAAWPNLTREEQELAAGRLQYCPKITLDHARVAPGQYSYYPWRTEAESNSANVARDVVAGDRTIEGYFVHLEHLELSKPFAHPNVLTKDREGRWQLLDPKQVPLPVMPPERAALPAGSPEHVYWPNKSKAEHYAMMRAEMVLRGHLSRDQYESLNAWASRYMNEKYPDPLAKCAEKFNSNAECGEASGVRKHPGDAAEPTEVVAPSVDEPVETRTHQEADASRSPTKLERLLASGRSMPASRRRRLEGLAARRRENGEALPVGTGSG